MRTIKLISAVCLLGMITILTNSCSKGDSYGSSGSATPAGGNNNSNIVSIQNRQFQPAALTIMEGSSVTVKNMDAETHTVTSDDGESFNSGNISPQGSYTIAPLAGAYPYHCSIHPSEKGTVYVAVRSN